MMGERKALENWEAIFGEATTDTVELGQQQGAWQATGSRRRFLFYAHALDDEGDGGGSGGSSRLEVVASDFHSRTFARTFTVHQLDDLRDDIGIGGSWSEFVDYLIASLSSGAVKLTLERASNVAIDSGDSLEVHAKLIAHKSKGLPRISLPLTELVNLSAKDATANFSLALFKAFKDKQNDSIKEHVQLVHMEGLLSSERERNESLQKQLDALSFVKRKVHKSKAPDKTSRVSDNAIDNNTMLSYGTQPSLSTSETQRHLADVGSSPIKNSQPAKPSQRVAPVSRRAKTRGVSLKDTGDDDNSAMSVTETQPTPGVPQMPEPTCKQLYETANFTATEEKPSVKDTQPAKVSQRTASTAASVSRRARTRGISFKDVRDDDN